MTAHRLLLAANLSTALLILSTILSPHCTADTVTIYPAGDTYLQESAPNYNYGDEIDIHLRNDLSQPYDRVVYAKHPSKLEPQWES